MRRLSRETASVLKTLKETRKSLIVTHYGEPVALLTPVLDRWGSPAPPVESHPLADDGDEYTEEEKTIIRLVEAGVGTPHRLSSAAGIDHRELSLTLGRLELKGAIR